MGEKAEEDQKRWGNLPAGDATGRGHDAKMLDQAALTASTRGSKPR